MKYSAKCWRLRLAVLVIGANWLTGCGTAGLEAGGVEACPQVLEYSRELQARAAEELTMLSNGSAIVGMMGDYAVIREEARAHKQPKL